MAQNGLVNIPHTAQHIPHDSALSVGSSSIEDASKIRELEDEVRQLAEKANVASQRFADYENDIRVLEAKLRQEQRKNNAAVTTISEGAEPGDTAPRPGISRFGSFMASRKVGAVPPTAAPHATAAREKELEEKLVKEQTARIAAETKVKDAQAEVEELTATLFQQANEMVATEREQNAALKKKMQELESQQNGVEGNPMLEKENTKLKEKIKVLEQREVDRKKRLERLESASKRIERVKALLQPP